jgi:putative FmdB family regulatory protein
MPVYLYVCKTCEHKEIFLSSIHDPEPVTTCPTCNKPMTRDYSIAGVNFKGKGWGKDAN